MCGGGLVTADDLERVDAEEGGRGGIGDLARGGMEDEVEEDGDEGKTFDMSGRVLRRAEDVGIVRRSAAGFGFGVEGRVGGTSYRSSPCIRLVECVCEFFARDAAVGAS